jgi:hypothetical protein
MVVSPCIPASSLCCWVILSSDHLSPASVFQYALFITFEKGSQETTCFNKQ